MPVDERNSPSVDPSMDLLTADVVYEEVRSQGLIDKCYEELIIDIKNLDSYKSFVDIAVPRILGDHRATAEAKIKEIKEISALAGQYHNDINNLLAETIQSKAKPAVKRIIQQILHSEGNGLFALADDEGSSSDLEVSVETSDLSSEKYLEIQSDNNGTDSKSVATRSHSSLVKADNEAHSIRQSIKLASQTRVTSDTLTGSSSDSKMSVGSNDLSLEKSQMPPNVSNKTDSKFVRPATRSHSSLVKADNEANPIRQPIKLASQTRVTSDTLTGSSSDSKISVGSNDLSLEKSQTPPNVSNKTDSKSGRPATRSHSSLVKADNEAHPIRQSIKLASQTRVTSDTLTATRSMVKTDKEVHPTRQSIKLTSRTRVTSDTPTGCTENGSFERSSKRQRKPNSKYSPQ